MVTCVAIDGALGPLVRAGAAVLCMTADLSRLWRNKRVKSNLDNFRRERKWQMPQTLTPEQIAEPRARWHLDAPRLA